MRGGVREAKAGRGDGGLVIFLDRGADVFQRFDVQALAQCRNLIRLDVAHDVDEHDVL